MKLELFKDVDGKWRVRLRARNGRILMSSEAYSRRAKAVGIATRLRREFGFAVAET